MIVLQSLGTGTVVSLSETRYNEQGQVASSLGAHTHDFGGFEHPARLLTETVYNNETAGGTALSAVFVRPVLAVGTVDSVVSVCNLACQI